jgi:hypothetical protein
MRSPALAAQWLSDNGFSDVRDLPGSLERNFRYTGNSDVAEEVRVVSAYWSTSENGRLFRSAPSAFVEKLVSRGTIVNAVFDDRGSVLVIIIGSNPRFPK